MDTLLKTVRHRANETTYSVAKAVGVSQPHYSRVENGESDASPELWAKLSEHFKVPLEMICNPSRYTAAMQERKAS